MNTVSVVRTKRSRDDYDQVDKEAMKPAKHRKKNVMTPRGSLVIARRYGMDELEVKKKLLEYKETGRFPNPLRRSGAYFGFIQALIELGVNEIHSYKAVASKMEEVMRKMPVKGLYSNAWEVFINRKPRNSLVGSDIFGRITRNAQTLQRLGGVHPYGRKLRQMMSCVDILAGDRYGSVILPAYRLNTNFAGYNDVVPQNDLLKHSKKRP
jgi:hypothetical protein